MKTGISILGLADVFQKVVENISNNTDVTIIDFQSDEFFDNDEVANFVSDTLKTMGYESNIHKHDQKYTVTFPKTSKKIVEELAKGFKKIADIILEYSDDDAVVEYSAIEFNNYQQIGKFVFETLVGMKCDVHNHVTDNKYVIYISA